MNADALNRNPVGLAEEDEDLGEEIRDIAGAHPDAPEEETELLCVTAGKDTDWMGIRRKDRRCIAQCLLFWHQSPDGWPQPSVVHAGC
jgi:hypothetical protein